ncbi:MAG: 16S rRNA (cytidine(1402)-2'-O)-methyltransferase [Woeseiaceae bacterium]|nr:16S rRNA (cytidine(1402)-2'-O)-methyltransferase [Woeseiaceae bacterium]
MSEGTLFVVATPIGNLDDLSPRAREALGRADLIAAEDTRVTGRLLSHVGIKVRSLALHDHNEEKVVPELIEALESGNSVALVSDAGTPLVSDPGYRLVRAAHNAGITVSPIPGPSAPVAALSASGLPSDRFVFEGFLPTRQAARKRRLEALRPETRTVLYFESVHRVAETISDMRSVLGDSRQAFIGRELSKLHEQCVPGSLAELADSLADGRIPLKGEFVIGVGGITDMEKDTSAADADHWLGELMAVMPGKQAVDIVARVTGVPRNTVYQQMLARKKADS